MIKGLNISKKYKKFALQPTSIEIDKGEIKKIRRCFGSWIYESGSKCLQ